MSLQRQHFLLSYLKTLSVGPVRVFELMTSGTGDPHAQSTEPTKLVRDTCKNDTDKCFAWLKSGNLHSSRCYSWSRGCFSKDPVTHRACKAILHTMICWLWKATLLICFSSGRKIAPNTGANATEFFTLATKSWKLERKSIVTRRHLAFR